VRQRLDNGNIHRLIVTQLLVMNGYLRLQSYDGFGWRRKEFNYRVTTKLSNRRVTGQWVQLAHAQVR